MEAEDPLKDLRDIHLPGDVPFWPPAPGWWLVLALVLVGLAFAYRHAIVLMIRRRKLANVLKELDAAYATCKEQSQLDSHRNQAGLDYLASVNRLLKRVAQVIYPRAGTANLTGSAWLAFLDECDGTTDFREGAGSALADGLYRRTYDTDTDALQALARRWIENRYQGAPAKPAKAGTANANTSKKEAAA